MFTWRRTAAALVVLVVAAHLVLYRSDVGAQNPTAPGGALAEAFLEARARGWNFVPGQAVVKFRAGSNSADRLRVLRTLRGQPAQSSLRWIGDRALVRDETERDSRILVERLREQPEVEDVELDYIQRWPGERLDLTAIDGPGPRSVPAGIPNDTQYNQLQWNMTLLDMPRAWDINPGGKSEIIVAVVDTGITASTQTNTYPLFTGTSIQNVAMPFDVNVDLPASRLVGARDFAFNIGAGLPVQDMEGHGTHVSGTIAEETNNATRLAGMAYRVRIMPVKVCLGYWELMIQNAQAGRTGFLPTDIGGCPQSTVAQGIRYAADNGAKVMNISLGGTNPSTVEREALAYAVGKGVFIAMSAGNEFEDGNPTTFPASYAEALPGAMSVASIGKSQTRAYYSSSGSFVEIAAPGGNSRDPGTGDDFGVVWQASMTPADSAPSIRTPRFDRYSSVGFQGTSMASPHVAGLAALLMAQGVTDPKNVEMIIRKTAKDLGASGKDNDFGYGLIQPRAAIFGSGLRK